MLEISIKQLQSIESQLLTDDESYIDGLTKEEQTQVIGASVPVVVASAITVTAIAAADSSYGCAANVAGITGAFGASVGAIVDAFDGPR